MVERKSMNIDGRGVELSQAYCASARYVYSVELN